MNTFYHGWKLFLERKNITWNALGRASFKLILLLMFTVVYLWCPCVCYKTGQHGYSPSLEIDHGKQIFNCIYHVYFVVPYFQIHVITKRNQKKRKEYCMLYSIYVFNQVCIQMVLTFIVCCTCCIVYVFNQVCITNGFNPRFLSLSGGRTAFASKLLCKTHKNCYAKLLYKIRELLCNFNIA